MIFLDIADVTAAMPLLVFSGPPFSVERSLYTNYNL